jgi:2-methylfumaryl-CoA hydratase
MLRSAFGFLHLKSTGVAGGSAASLGHHMSEAKTTGGHFFEDFRIGQIITHATPRTITTGDVAVYNALYGSRFALQSAEAFARDVGYPSAPVDDLLVFHIVFGKTVPDISLNAVANLGYADCRFLIPVVPGDTLRAISEVIGLKENSNRETGVVYVRSRGMNQRGQTAVEYVRWVMVRKRRADAPVAAAVVPALPERVDLAVIGQAVPNIDRSRWNFDLAGSRFCWGDYAVGECIDHVDGMTIEEAEHQMATRLYQNTAKVHFNQHTEGQGRFGRRLVYGGVIISIARALSFNGLANAFHVAAINGGRHSAPAFAGDTVYAATQVVDAFAIAGRNDIAGLRLRTLAFKNRRTEAFAEFSPGARQAEGVILELDYVVVLPC